MPFIFTKPATEVFAPTTGGGAPRGAVMGEAATWGDEVEDALEALEDSIGQDNAGDAIVILATGQSNIQSNPAYSWTPPANLYRWNGSGSSVGTAFAAMTSSNMALAYSYGAEVARANPTRQVYVINIGAGSQAIAQWMTGAGAPDMYAYCKDNVEAALSVLGVSKINRFVWWQGESDKFAGSTTYFANWHTVIARFIAESWFPRETPIAIMSVSHQYSLDTSLKDFNQLLQQIADVEPQFRTFVDMTPLAQTYWDAPTNYLHMTGAGYEVAGKVAYRATHDGAGQGRIATPWRTRLKLANESRISTTTLANDGRLQFAMKSGGNYRIRGSIWVQSATAADFKYGFTGPAAIVINGTTRVIAGDTPTAETISMVAGSAYPTNQTILQSTSQYALIEFEFYIAAPSADGIFAFQWAQNTSNAGTTRVFAGSYLEFIEVS